MCAAANIPGVVGVLLALLSRTPGCEDEQATLSSRGSSRACTVAVGPPSDVPHTCECAGSTAAADHGAAATDHDAAADHDDYAAAPAAVRHQRHLPMAYLATTLRNEDTFQSFLDAAAAAGLRLRDESAALRCRHVRFAQRLSDEARGRVMLSAVTLL